MAEKKNRVVMTGEQLLNAYRNEQAKFEMLQNRMQQLQQVLRETKTAEEAVSTIKKSAKNEKIIVDLGAGIYTEAVLEGNEKFKKSLAGSILQNTDSKKALETLKGQQEKLSKDMEMTQKEMQNVTAKLNEIGAYLRAAEQQAAQKTGNTNGM